MKCFKQIFCCVVCVATIGAIFGTFTGNDGNKQEAQAINENDILDLRKEVMQRYFDELPENVKEQVDFCEFDQGYYESDLSIRDYTDSFKSSDKINKYNAKIPNFYIDINAARKKGYSDKPYILSNFRRDGDDQYPSNDELMPVYSAYQKTREGDQNSAVCFSIGNDPNRYPSKPRYDGNNYEYYKELLRPGDIVWDPKSDVTLNFLALNIPDFGDFVTHTGMIVNTQKKGYFSEDSNDVFYFIETIEAYSSGVRFGYLDDERILFEGTQVLRTRASFIKISDALDFMFAQLGKAYMLNPFEDPFSRPELNTRNEWYCTQLVFSAYWYAYYDISYCHHPYSTIISDSNNKCVGSFGQFLGVTAITGDSIFISDETYLILGANITEHFIEMKCNLDLNSNTTATELKQNLRNQTRIVTYASSTCTWADIVKEDYLIYSSNKTWAAVGVDTMSVSIPGDPVDTTFYSYTIENGKAYVSTARRIKNEYAYVNFAIELYDLSPRLMYQIGKTNSGNWKLQIKIPYGSYNKWFRIPSAFLNESDAKNWNLPNGVDDRYCFNLESDITYVYDIADVNGSANYLPIADFTSSTREKIPTALIKVDKINNKYTINQIEIKRSVFSEWKESWYASLKIVNKSGSKWTIKITNNAQETVFVYYNKKMCFSGDAKKFSGLRDIDGPHTLAPNQSMQVVISENWFADSIAICIERNQIGRPRYVTYANNLNAKKMTLTEYHNAL